MKSERPYDRTDRVANEIQNILGQIQTQYIDLTELGFITFTKVIVSPDLKHAKIFFGVVNNKKSIDKISIELNKPNYELAYNFTRIIDEITYTRLPDISEHIFN